MKRMKLSAKEKAIEKALVRGEYRPVNRQEFQNIVEAVKRSKKDAVLNIRVNRQDLEALKRKARRLGVPYQSLLSELIHHFAT